MAKGDAPGETADDGKGKAADQKPDDKTGTKPEDNSAADESTKPEPKAADKGTKAEDKTFTQAEFDRELAKQKKEFEKAAQKEKERADLSEAEKKDAELDDLRTQLRLRDAKDDVVAALEKEGARSTGLMWNAIKSDLEFDDKGKLVNLTTLIKDLRADYPDQFGEAKPTDSIDGGKGQAGNGLLTKDKLSKMTPREIAELDWEEVKKALSEK